MAPVVHGLEAEYFGRVGFVYLDVYSGDAIVEDFIRELGYQYHPHFLLLDGDGKIIAQWVGPVSEENLVEAFLAALR